MLLSTRGGAHVSPRPFPHGRTQREASDTAGLARTRPPPSGPSVQPAGFPYVGGRVADLDSGAWVPVLPTNIELVDSCRPRLRPPWECGEQIILSMGHTASFLTFGISGLVVKMIN